MFRETRTFTDADITITFLSAQPLHTGTIRWSVDLRVDGAIVWDGYSTEANPSVASAEALVSLREAEIIAARKGAAEKVTLRLVNCGDYKINAIKTVREVLSITLRDARDVVDVALTSGLASDMATRKRLNDALEGYGYAARFEVAT